MKQSLMLFLILCVLNIGHIKAETASTCPLAKNDKTLIEETISRNSQEAKWVLNQTHGGTFQDRGFAKNLIGNSSNQLSVATLIEQCTGPRQFVAFCEPVCDSSGQCSHLKRCSQLGCEAAAIDTIKVWWQPAPIKYKTDQHIIPDFNIIYPNRPTVNFRFDSTREGVVDITWHAEDKVNARAGQDIIIADSILNASGRTNNDGPLNGHVEVLFPQIPGHKLSTRIVFDIDHEGHETGTIRVGNEIVGKIIPGDEEQDPKINWSNICL